jgi:acetate kinase
MGGIDAIVFTAGIGENSDLVREAVCKDLEFLGVKFDPSKNKVRGKEAELTTPDSKVKVYVIPTNEELVIARDTKELALKG